MKFKKKKIQWLAMARAGSDHNPCTDVVSIKRSPK